MADLSGHTITRGCITLPRTGAWSARVHLAEDVTLEGTQTLTLEDLSLNGSVLRQGKAHGKTAAYLTGGAGTLSKHLEARTYRSVNRELILRELARELGENLAPLDDTWATRVEQYCRPAQQGYFALEGLCGFAGATWRFLPDGTLFAGTETWPTAEHEGDVLQELPIEGLLEVAFEKTAPLPGEVWQDHRLSTVEHHIHPDRWRTALWTE